MTRSLIVEADGGSRGNPGPAAFGAVVRDGVSGVVLAELASYIGHATNNVAEYRGMIAGLEQARSIDRTAVVEVRLDSKLVVEQMTGRWKIKHPQMQQLALQARSILPAGQVTFTWVRREMNSHADSLVNEVLDQALAGGDDEIRRVPGFAGPEGDGEDVIGSAEEEHVKALAGPGQKPGNRMIGWADLGAPTTTLLVRHGATRYSLERRFSGRGGVDVPLAEIGERQASAVAEELAVRGGVDAIVSSPLLRTRQTAQIIGERLALPVAIDDDFAECSFGEWDGRTFADVQAQWPDLIDEWLRSTSIAPPGGESFQQVRERVNRGRARVVAAHPAQRVLIVSHVTPIKVMVGLAIDAPLSTLFRMELAPCSVTTLAWFADGNASMFGFSEVAHLRDVQVPSGT